jgi:uncharacterized repeat protein (TIGR03833 family)
MQSQGGEELFGLLHTEVLSLRSAMNGQHRKNVQAGVEVDIILKKDQGSTRLTRGIVKDILTRSSVHPQGIKVRLVSGDVGRVQEVFDAIDKKP